jgi:hypothetical protein
MNTLQTQNRHAGVHGGSEMIGPASGPMGNGYTASILHNPPSCQSPTARTCYAQVVYHLAMAERWLDLASEVRS